MVINTHEVIVDIVERYLRETYPSDVVLKHVEYGHKVRGKKEVAGEIDVYWVRKGLLTSWINYVEVKGNAGKEKAYKQLRRYQDFLNVFNRVFDYTGWHASPPRKGSSIVVMRPLISTIRGLDDIVIGGRK